MNVEDKAAAQQIVLDAAQLARIEGTPLVHRAQLIQCVP